MHLDPVGTVMAWISAYGLIGLFVVALSERFVPVMPSYGFLLAVGIAAADGAWSLPAAFLATAAGSLFGCAACFFLVRALGDAWSRRLLYRAGRVFGMPGERIERWIAVFQRNQRTLAISVQLVPTIRLFAPAFAALMRADARTFLTASAAGIAIWTALFIGVGVVASQSLPTANTTVLAMSALGCLLLAEAALLWICPALEAQPWPGRCAMRELIIQRRDSSAVDTIEREIGAEHLAQQRPLAETFGFFRAWLRAPLQVAAVAPSGRALAGLMTSEVSGDTGPVIELGPGTGAFTRALLSRGVRQEDLALIEFGSEFAAALHFRYPRARTLWMDAARLRTVVLFDGRPAGAVISGLPVLSMPPRKVVAILSGAFRKLRSDGALYQFTYGPRCPVPRAVLDHLGLEADRIGGTLANLPPKVEASGSNPDGCATFRCGFFVEVERLLPRLQLITRSPLVQ